MTLVTATASHWFALQVTDRLLTRAGAEFDPVSNKNIVFEARDALVAIGYTGDAYLDGRPTDQWLVETLTGETYARSGDRPAGIHMGRIPHWRHLGPALDLRESTPRPSQASLRASRA